MDAIERTRGRGRLRLGALLLAAAVVATLGRDAGAARAQTVPPESDEEEVTFVERFGVGGWNVIRLTNRQDGRMRVRANVELNHIKGDTATPVNYAEALSSCADCAAFSVALQLNLVRPGASTVAPWNRAFAANVNCTRCVSVARAVQFLITVDDPDSLPPDVDALIKEMDKELREIAWAGRRGELSVTAANARISAVIARFSHLGMQVIDAQEEAPASGG